MAAGVGRQVNLARTSVRRAPSTAIGHGLAHRDPGDLGHHVVEALQVLNVDGGEDVNASLPAGPPRPGNAWRGRKPGTLVWASSSTSANWGWRVSRLGQVHLAQARVNPDTHPHAAGPLPRPWGAAPRSRARPWCPNPAQDDPAPLALCLARPPSSMA